jgi:hypothetical protein
MTDGDGTMAAGAAPARDACGRFVAGNAGRKPGSRNRASNRLAMALLDDFNANEAANIERLRRWFFPQYVQLMGRFLPREAGGARPDFEGYSAEETVRVTAAARAALERIERGEAGLDALLAALERDPATEAAAAGETAPATVNYGDSTVDTAPAAAEPSVASGWPLRRNY